jgi:hypothetical protein
LLFDAIEKGKRNSQEQREGDERAAGHERKLHLHAQQRAGNGRHHRECEQHVGVAQHAVGALRQNLRLLTVSVELHENPPN